MKENNQDIDIFFRQMEQISEPDMQHYQANWNAMQDMMAGETILRRNHRWNPGMLNSLFTMIVGGCLVAGLIFIFNTKQQPKNSDSVNPPATQLKPALPPDSVRDTLQNNSTLYKQNKTDSVKTANTQPKDANSQTKVANSQMKVANKLTKANIELIDQSIQTYQSDTLIPYLSEAGTSLNSLTKVTAHSKKPALQSVPAIDSSIKNKKKTSLSIESDSIITHKSAEISAREAGFDISVQKSSFIKPVSCSIDTVVIPFKNTNLKPSKKSRMATRVDTTTRKQKHLPDQTIHH